MFGVSRVSLYTGFAISHSCFSSLRLSFRLPLSFASPATTANMAGTFEVDMSKYKEVEVDPWKHTTLPADAKAQLLANIELCRDAVVFFTACGSASGYGGHTGGAFDTMPEVLLLRSFFKARSS